MTGYRDVMAVATIALCGCFSPSYQEGVACGGGGLCPAGQVCHEGVCRSPDMIPDAAIDAGDCPNPTALMFTPSNFDICDLPVDPPLIELTASSTTLDTDAGTLGGEAMGILLEQTSGPEIMLFATREFTLGASNFLDVVGARPAVIVSLGDMNIDGVILATGNGVEHGPGGNADGLCTDGTGADGVMETAEGDGGGGGGGFGFAGGEGGGAPPSAAAPGGPSGGDTGKAYVAAGGAMNGTGLLSPLRGGCPGGKGGGIRGGAGGGAGGAVQLVAAGTIRFGAGAVLNVGGGFGRGAGTTNTADLIDGAGGGGGGSGGGALLEAGLGIVLNGGSGLDSVITAAGGGGGGGACGENIGAVENGDGRNGGSLGPGTGGMAGSDGTFFAGAGGDGGGDGDVSLPGVPGATGNVSCAGRVGGGGGGGGAGRILLRSPSVTTDGLTFPPPDTTAL